MTRYSPRTGLPTQYQAGPYDSAHLYLQWGGKLPGGESWSCGMRFANTGGAGVAGDAATLLPAASTAVQNYHTSAGAAISQYAKLSFVKLNHIGTDGHYSQPNTNEAILADIAGAAASGMPTNQIAWAVSLTTGVSRGPAHRGRFYVPLPVANLGTDGLVVAATRDTFKTAANTFLTALFGLSAVWDPAVFSRKQGAPTHRNITGCEVGRVLDTQRRRRKSLTELWA